MIVKTCFILIVALAPVTVGAEPDVESFVLSRQVLLATDNTLVVKLSIEAPDRDAAEVVKLHYRWHDKTSHAGALGLLDRADGKRRAEIFIVAQVASGAKHHPPMLMLTVNQSSGAAKRAFEAHVLKADQKLAEVIAIDVEEGKHAIGEKRRIGTLGGEAIYLSVGSADAK